MLKITYKDGKVGVLEHTRVYKFYPDTQGLLTAIAVDEWGVPHIINNITKVESWKEIQTSDHNSTMNIGSV